MPKPPWPITETISNSCSRVPAGSASANSPGSGLHAAPSAPGVLLMTVRSSSAGGVMAGV